MRRPRRAALVIGGGLSVLAICMIVVRDGEVGGLEESVFRTINELPNVLEVPIWVFQLMGVLGVIASLSVAALILRRYRLAIALATAIPVKLALEWWVVKAWVERERPEFTVEDAIVRGSSGGPLGFPSGHAVFAFVIAGLLAPYLGRRATVAVYTLAVLNSFARVYLGAHNPLDVVAGAGLGVAIAAALNLAVGVPAERRSS